MGAEQPTLMGPSVTDEYAISLSETGQRLPCRAPHPAGNFEQQLSAVQPQSKYLTDPGSMPKCARRSERFTKGHEQLSLTA